VLVALVPLAQGSDSVDNVQVTLKRGLNASNWTDQSPAPWQDSRALLSGRHSYASANAAGCTCKCGTKSNDNCEKKKKDSSQCNEYGKVGSDSGSKRCKKKRQFKQM
jgi:hypothetical protein